MHEKFCKGGLEVIMGTLIILENVYISSKMSLVRPSPQRGNEESLLLDSLTQAVRHTDCSINPARHTDWYARSPSPDSKKKTTEADAAAQKLQYTLNQIFCQQLSGMSTLPNLKDSLPQEWLLDKHGLMLKCNYNTISMNSINKSYYYTKFTVLSALLGRGLKTNRHVLPIRNRILQKRKDYWWSLKTSTLLDVESTICLPVI